MLMGGEMKVCYSSFPMLPGVLGTSGSWLWVGVSSSVAIGQAVTSGRLCFLMDWMMG